MIDNESSQTEQREPSQIEVAGMIADTLNERQAHVRHSIVRIVRALGRTQARELLAKTLEIEQNGGMMLPDNSRRRTPGGVFFYLTYTIGQTKDGKALERPQKFIKKPKKPNAQPVKTENTTVVQKSTTQPSTPFTWEDRIAAIKEAEQEKGQATVKITVIGRPGKIVDRGTCIVTAMESSKSPSLPKGLPTPTDVVTKYIVYVAKKQWNKVEEAIKDPEDSLIIEGYPKIDTEVSAIAVFATNVTTKKLQSGKRQAEQKN